MSKSRAGMDIDILDWVIPALVVQGGWYQLNPKLHSLWRGPYNNITRKGPAGLVRLHVSTKTAHTQNPILFAESGLCTRY
jgi:hypothetical protein